MSPTAHNKLPRLERWVFSPMPCGTSWFHIGTSDVPGDLRKFHNGIAFVFSCASLLSGFANLESGILHGGVLASSLFFGALGLLVSKVFSRMNADTGAIVNELQELGCGEGRLTRSRSQHMRRVLYLCGGCSKLWSLLGPIVV